MNRRKEWEKAQKTPESMKAFLADLAEKEQEWVKTGYSDGNYTRKLIEEALAETKNPEKRAVLLECSRLCPPVDSFADLSLDIEEEEKTYPIYWEPGEIVKFGRYPQGANGEVKPIEWIVLETSIEGYMRTGSNACLLLSRYALEEREYNEKKVDITWETCGLRAWLNGKFLQQAFSEKEQEKLVLKKLHNSGIEIKMWIDREYHDSIEETEFISGGNITEDKVFILSDHDIEHECDIPEELKVCSLARTHKKCKWWLRAPSFDAETYWENWDDFHFDDLEDGGFSVEGQNVDTLGWTNSYEEATARLGKR